MATHRPPFEHVRKVQAQIEENHKIVVLFLCFIIDEDLDVFVLNRTFLCDFYAIKNYLGLQTRE